MALTARSDKQRTVSLTNRFLARKAGGLSRIKTTRREASGEAFTRAGACPSRIPIRVQVPPWDAEAVRLYVRHRMTSAGCRREVFSDDALLLMAKAAGGILRKIDILGDHCLAIALKSKSGLIDAAIVQQGIRACGDALL